MSGNFHTRLYTILLLPVDPALSIPPTSHLMVIHFTAMHCPPGSLKTVVSSSFDFSDPFCPLRHIKRLVTSFIFFYHSSIYPSILCYVIHDNQGSRYRGRHSGLHKKIHRRHTVHVDLNQKRNDFWSWEEEQFCWKKGIVHQPAAAEDGLPSHHPPFP